MMIRSLFLYYWHICLLQESPENTPYSLELLGISAFALIFVLITQWQFSDVIFAGNFIGTLLAAASLIISYVIYTFVIFYLKGVVGRLVQTLTALFFTRIIIHILASPLILLDPFLLHANLKNPMLLFIGVIYLFIALGLSVWQFVITAHIYKLALNIPAIQSVLAAFGLLAINILMVSFWR